MLASGRATLTEVTAYNVAAFCTQPFIGYATDRWNLAKQSATAGYLLVSCGVLSALWLSWPAIFLIGFGNACFHVGAGSQCVQASPKHFGPLGLFVGPGALGLVLGKICGLADSLRVLGWCALALLVGYGLFNRINCSDESGTSREAPRLQATSVFSGGAILFCVALRSLIGSTVEFAWDDSTTTSVLLGASLCAGKMFGGLLADRFGAVRTAVVALALAAPLLVLGAVSAVPGLLGAALFQVPMALTLGLLAHMLPRRPGLAFGLASAAILLGPYSAVKVVDWQSPAVLVGGAAASILLLCAAIKISGYPTPFPVLLRRQNTV